MKWSFETYEAKRVRLSQWAAWFAWRPVRYRTEDGKNQWLWLERVYRRAIGHTSDGFWEWEYALNDFEVLKSESVIFKPYPGWCVPPPSSRPPAKKAVVRGGPRSSKK